ncbi:MAG: type VII toxin-antitoxin system HepT family RNase toxin [Anaerolineae bacterium]
MTNVNVEMVKAKADDIRANVEKVHRYSSLPDDEFFADERNLYSVQHLLLLAIEASVSICLHLTSRLAGTAPASYSECFGALLDAGIIDEDLSQRLTSVVRFRNLLVHQYWEVDPRRVVLYARSQTRDFTDFLEAVGRLLEGETLI